MNNALTATPDSLPIYNPPTLDPTPFHLHACPFCQSRAAVSRIQSSAAAIQCAVCAARGPAVTKEHGRTMRDCLRLAVASWNRAAALRAVVEA